MKINRNPLIEMADIASGDTRQVRLMSCVVMYMACGAFIGLQLDPHPHSVEDMRIMLHIAPAWFWAVMFGVIAAIRAIGLFMWRGNVLTRVITPFVGACLWAAMFASNAIGNPTDATFSILYLVPTAMEGWLMGRGVVELLGVLNGR